MEMKRHEDIVNGLVPDNQMDIKTLDESGIRLGRKKTKTSANYPSNNFPAPTRKATDWSEANPLSDTELSGDDLVFIDDLVVFSAEDVYPEEQDPSPFTEFSASSPMEQYFILNLGGQQYLVDTQGYEYARYIWRLEF